jgi:hypothetical protein
MTRRQKIAITGAAIAGLAAALALHSRVVSKSPRAPLARPYRFTYAAALRPAMRPNTEPAISPVPLA